MRQGSHVGANLGFGSLSNFSRLWAVGVASSCLVPDPGNLGLVCRSWIKVVVGHMAFGLVALHIKDTLTEEYFAVS